MFSGEYAYLILDGLYAVVWCCFFFLRKDLKKELCMVTLLSAPLGYTDPLYYDYWRPEFFFPIFSRAGLESLLWAGLVSGVGAVSYELLAKRRTYQARQLSPGWMGRAWLAVSATSAVLILYIGTRLLGLNSAYVSICGFLVMTIVIVVWRRDLLRDALMSGVALATITLLVYQVWLVLYPSAFSDYWQVQNLSGIFIVRVPIEELAYTFAWGTVIGPFYEFIEGFRLRKLTAGRRA